MRFYRSLLIKDTEIVAGGKIIVLKRGQEFLTSAEKNRKVRVYTLQWQKDLDEDLFAGREEIEEL